MPCISVLVLWKEANTEVSNRTITVLKFPNNPSTLGFFNFMKYKDWSDFVIHCSRINEIMAKPKGCTDLTKGQYEEYNKLLGIDDLTEKQKNTFKVLSTKRQRWIDPKLSKVAINHLIRRYGFDKYNKRMASVANKQSHLVKGNELEDESISIISGIDRIDYIKCKEVINNGYLLGVCDIISPKGDKLIDVKTSWNINTFLPYLNSTLDRSYWFQMQGYLELYNVEVGEICFVLINTPQYLVDRERLKYTEKYLFGEISRERYDEEISRLELAFNYNKIPTKTKVIRFNIARCREVIPLIYRKVDKCRIWLNEFEQVHISNKVLYTSSDLYIHQPEESNLIDN